jgi:hypothetical protein
MEYQLLKRGRPGVMPAAGKQVMRDYVPQLRRVLSPWFQNDQTTCLPRDKCPWSVISVEAVVRMRRFCGDAKEPVSGG